MMSVKSGVGEGAEEGEKEGEGRRDGGGEEEARRLLGRLWRVEESVGTCKRVRYAVSKAKGRATRPLRSTRTYRKLLHLVLGDGVTLTPLGPLGAPQRQRRQQPPSHHPPIIPHPDARPIPRHGRQPDPPLLPRPPHSQLQLPHPRHPRFLQLSHRPTTTRPRPNPDPLLLVIVTTTGHGGRGGGEGGLLATERVMLRAAYAGAGLSAEAGGGAVRRGEEEGPAVEGWRRAGRSGFAGGAAAASAARWLDEDRWELDGRRS